MATLTDVVFLGAVDAIRRPTRDGTTVNVDETARGETACCSPVQPVTVSWNSTRCSRRSAEHDSTATDTSPHGLSPHGAAAAVVLLACLVLPVAVFFVYGFWTSDLFGIHKTWTLDQYRSALSGFYLEVLLKTLATAIARRGGRRCYRVRRPPSSSRSG